MDEMGSVRTGQVVGAFLSSLAGIFTIIVTSVIQILTIKAMAKLSILAPEPDTPLTTSYYYPESPYYPYFNSIQYKYVDYHHHQHSHQPRQVYHQVCQWRLVKESGPIKTIYKISSSLAATINTTQIIIILNPTSLPLPQLIMSGKETEERKNDRINIIRSH